MLSSMVRGTFQMWFRTMRWGDDPNHESLEVGWGKRRVGTEIWFWEGLRPIIHGFEEPRKAAAFRSWECPLAYSQQTTETDGKVNVNDKSEGRRKGLKLLRTMIEIGNIEWKGFIFRGVIFHQKNLWHRRLWFNFLGCWRRLGREKAVELLLWVW